MHTAEGTRVSVHGVSGRIAISELVLVVAVAVALIVSGGGLVADGPLPWIVAGSVALLVLALVWARWQGRYVLEVLGTRMRFRPDAADARPGDPLDGLLDGAEVAEQIDRAGNRVGLLGADGEWTAVIRLAQTSTVDITAVLTTLRAVYDRPDIPLRAASLTIWSVPGMRDRNGRPGDPISVYWLAVRYNAADAPQATLARGGAATGARRATASAAMGLVSALSAAGNPGAVLAAADLRSELRVAFGAGPAGEPTVVRENWRELNVRHLRQYCYLPVRRAAGRALLGACLSAAEFTVSSYTLGRRYHGRTRAHVALRVGVAERGGVPDARKMGAALGAKVRGCDGTQREVTVSTLPLAAAFTRR